MSVVAWGGKRGGGGVVNGKSHAALDPFTKSITKALPKEHFPNNMAIEAKAGHKSLPAASCVFVDPATDTVHAHRRTVNSLTCPVVC